MYWLESQCSEHERERERELEQKSELANKTATVKNTQRPKVKPTEVYKSHLMR